ncbi:alpha-1,2-fucosyltransferase [Terriglobus roseus]|uniref:Glycosyl transferase family 11 n=1 Tax=Terriglobus roseus TaxID=392734 RepID=A0A1H4IZ26_9BACT|nr:alpha-1,2-fucosyltransferase [Terriglobus roseus]SEB39293.1 Glycosyl transferase family 11 [Terriglobus roseus]
MTKPSVLDLADERETATEVEAAPSLPKEGAWNRGRLIVNCDGGLGNQMFEYAAGLYFAREFSRTLEVLKPIAAHQQWNGYRRPFQLSEFCITAPVREAGILDRLLVSRSAKTRRLRGMLRSLLGAEALEEPQAYTWQPARIGTSLQRSAYLVGYWQAAAYVEAVAPQVREQFALKQPLKEHNLRFADKIRRLLCPVSVHVRMGDYTLIRHATGNEKTVSQVLSWEYYKRAIVALEAACDSSFTLVVFSDDPPKARELLGGIANCIFVEGNGPDTAQEEMMLMSLYRHHIIANSSFSWWGAWLNEKSDKRVFAPRFWGNTPDSYFPDLYPAGWETVQNL